jgi:hypothetical protein
MEFLNGIFNRVFGHKLKSSQTKFFYWLSTIILPFYKMLFMNRLEFIKTRVEHDFL